MDACFRFKSLFCSEESVDPGLHTGHAYFVEQDMYNRHIGKYPAQTDVSFQLGMYGLQFNVVLCTDQLMQQLPNAGAR